MNPADNQKPEANTSDRTEEIDLSLLEDSLRLTPWQRLVENERALALIRMLEAAQPPPNGKSQSNP